MVVAQPVHLEHDHAAIVVGRRVALPSGELALDDGAIERTLIVDAHQAGDDHIDHRQHDAADDGREPAVDRQPAAHHRGRQPQHHGIDEEPGDQQNDEPLTHDHQQNERPHGQIHRPQQERRAQRDHPRRKARMAAQPNPRQKPGRQAERHGIDQPDGGESEQKAKGGACFSHGRSILVVYNFSCAKRRYQSAALRVTRFRL